VGKAYGVVGTMGDLGELLGPLIAGVAYIWQAFWPFGVVGSLFLLSMLASASFLNRRLVVPRDA
jgi:hypothetical protein